jgi:hypothetical protein
MEETTLEAGPHRDLRTLDSGRRERLGVWLYTGAPGRLASFSIDLGLSLAALGIYGARQAWRRIRRVQSPAA